MRGEGDNDERTDHRTDAVASVADTEAMRATLQCGTSKQGVETNVQRTEAEADEKDACQEQGHRMR